ncbi:hypothetical protein MHU86_16706 [Fragilaria crotonensis]|nr:hypothetical protein MHU86_16706 [Fragilaria crotonensis]
MATKTNRRCILVLGNGANHQVDLLVVEGRFGHGRREVRRRGFNASDDGRRRPSVDDCCEDGGSPISDAYSTNVVASCANESLNGSAPSCPVRLSRSTKRRISGAIRTSDCGPKGREPLIRCTCEWLDARAP